VKSLLAWFTLVTAIVPSPVHAESTPPPSYQVLLRGNPLATFAVAEGLRTERTSTVPGPIRLAQGRVHPEFLSWIQQLRANPGIRTEEITIREVDPSGQILRSWRLVRVGVRRWTGPTLNAQPGADVAMDEVVLSAEGITTEGGEGIGRRTRKAFITHSSRTDQQGRPGEDPEADALALARIRPQRPPSPGPDLQRSASFGAPPPLARSPPTLSWNAPEG